MAVGGGERPSLDLNMILRGSPSRGSGASACFRFVDALAFGSSFFPGPKEAPEPPPPPMMARTLMGLRCRGRWDGTSDTTPYCLPHDSTAWCKRSAAPRTRLSSAVIGPFTIPHSLSMDGYRASKYARSSEPAGDARISSIRARMRGEGSDSANVNILSTIAGSFSCVNPSRVSAVAAATRTSSK